PEPDADAPPAGNGVSGDLRARGVLAHRLLERFDFRWLLEGPQRVAERLEALLGDEHLTPRDEGVGEILEGVGDFLRGPFAATLAQRPPERIHRALPFLLRLPEVGTGRAVYLKGQLDLLIEQEDGSACVLDYKYSRPHARGLLPYAFQL